MFEDYGEYLCHYTTRETAFRLILPSRRIRLSPYTAMRDPLEYTPWTFGAGFFTDAFEDEQEEARVYGQAQELLNQIKRETKLLALTQDARSYEGIAQMFGRCWARARMWEHYGENHEGVCLVFRKRDFGEQLRADFTRRGVDEIYEGEVGYTPEGIAGEIGALDLMLEEFKKGMDEAVKRHLESYYRELFLLKTLEWESEHEYRYAVHTPANDFEFVDFGDTLDRVIVGVDFPAWEAGGALEVCEDRGVEAFRLRWLKEGPWPVPLEPYSATRTKRMAKLRARLGILRSGGN
jgi:Protein of unknown function (DUF2971)